MTKSLFPEVEIPRSTSEQYRRRLQAAILFLVMFIPMQSAWRFAAWRTPVLSNRSGSSVQNGVKALRSTGDDQ